ncbi:MAG TPA: DUF4097 family beta strand repeat-containing protein [Caballeronia sp.]|nr:DUF4097 family beta strand repeat-containing protein [Caballeronia sp.]
MSPKGRWTLIAVLSVVELALLGAMLHSVGLAGGASEADGRRFMMGAPVFASTPSQTFEKTFDNMSATPSVYVDDNDAELTLTVKSGSSVSVREQTSHGGWMHRSGGKLDVSQTGDHLRIVRSDETLTMMFGSLHRTLQLVVPPGTHLEVANAGKIDVTGLRENVLLHSDNGAIYVHDHRAEITATSSNGRIELHDVVAAAVEATSDNGRIVLDNVRADALAVKADNGRITGSQVLTSGGSIIASNGRVLLGLAQGSDITVTASAASGHVRAESPFTFDAVPSSDDDDDGKPRTLRIGNGTGKLAVSTDNGSITISQGEVSL